MIQNNRWAYIDAVAGLMIVWMILGHCSFFSHYGLPYREYLSFYMPWFFYKSGFFFFEKSQCLLLKKDSNKLLRYYIVYSIIGWGVWSICGMIDDTLSLRRCFAMPLYEFFHHGSISGNGALWFLFSLFIVRQCSNYLIKQKVPLPFLKAICFVLALLMYKMGWYNYSWWFGNIFSGMFFFLMGYWLKDKEDNSKLFLTSIIVFGSVLLAYIGGLTMDFPYLYMHANKMYRGDYVLFYPMALAGIIMTNNVFRIVSKYVRFQILGYIGRNSMNFYVTHWILFVAVSFIAKSTFHIDSSFLLFILLLCSSVVFLPLISKSIDTLKANNYYLNKIL